MEVDVFAFQTIKPGVACAKFIDGKRGNVGHARNQRRQEHFGETELPIHCRQTLRQVFLIKPWDVFLNHISHGIDTSISGADVFDRVGVIGNFGSFDSLCRVRQSFFVSRKKL